MTKNKHKVAMAVVGLLAAGAFYATPYLAVHNIKSAIDKGDSEKMASYIDFPSVKEHLKNSLNAKFQADMQDSQELRNNPFAGLGQMMAAAIIPTMVDALVTPENMKRTMQGQKPKKETQPGSEEANQDSNLEKTMGYTDFGRFVLSVNKKDNRDQKVQFVLTRDGIFGWKLRQIDLPI